MNNTPKRLLRFAYFTKNQAATFNDLLFLQFEQILVQGTLFSNRPLDVFQTRP